MTLETVASVLASALVLGSLYALMAAGLSLVWTTLGIFNFTHGVFMTIAAYVAWQVSDGAGLGLGGAAGAAVAISALAGLGCIAERLLIRPFLGRENIVMIAVITTLAALSFLENAIQLVWGPLRHIVGHNVAAYHRNADGVRVELFCEMDLMKDEALGYWEPRPWHEEMPLRPKHWPKDTWRSQWGFGSFGTFPGYP